MGMVEVGVLETVAEGEQEEAGGGVRAIVVKAAGVEVPLEGEGEKKQVLVSRIDIMKGNASQAQSAINGDFHTSIKPVMMTCSRDIRITF